MSLERGKKPPAIGEIQGVGDDNDNDDRHLLNMYDVLSAC